MSRTFTACAQTAMPRYVHVASDFAACSSPTTPASMLTTFHPLCSSLFRCVPAAAMATRKATVQAVSQMARSTPACAVLARSSMTHAGFLRPRSTMAAPVGLGTALLNFGKNNPFLFQLIMCTAKTSVCDLLIQVYVEKKRQIDWKRNGVFMLFGSFYLGGFQYLVYSIWMPRIFPNAARWANLGFREKLRDRAGLVTLAKQVAFDNLVHNPFMYCPVFYCFKALMHEDDGSVAGDSAGPLGVVKSALSSYRKNFVVDNISMCALVVPGDILAFGAPMWLRLPANHLISFFWVCYLSFLRGGAEKVEPAQSSVEAEMAAVAVQA